MAVDFGCLSTMLSCLVGKVGTEGGVRWSRVVCCSKCLSSGSLFHLGSTFYFTEATNASWGNSNNSSNSKLTSSLRVLTCQLCSKSLLMSGLFSDLSQAQINYQMPVGCRLSSQMTRTESPSLYLQNLSTCSFLQPSECKPTKGRDLYLLLLTAVSPGISTLLEHIWHSINI